MSGVVGFVGLDSFSFELASSLLRSGFKVQAFEISTELVEKFIELGGHKCDSPADVGKAAAAVVVVLSHPDQIQDVIFGDEGVMKGLQKDAVLLLSSTISTLQLQKLEKQLTEKREQIFVVDAYVLKGMSELLDGKLMIIASGRSDSITRAQPYLTAMCQNLYTFEGEIGAGSKVKMVNELLEGIHLVAAVEAISLGSQAGVHPWILYDIISNAAGNSWIYKNHIPLLLKDDIEGRFLDVLSQNLAIVEDKAKSLPFPVPLLAVARQQLISGISQMQGDDTATSLAKISEKVLGVGILEAANRELYKPEDLAKEITTQAKPVNRIGFIGLGAMGFGMAAHLLKSNFSVCGYDVSL
jgi:3-hydroxyisobutyrate dehydrogenase-like beta-hydroxyacid dehydrogenase